VLALSALALAFAPAAHASGGVSPRIVGGNSVTDIATRPYQVAVLPPLELCGGVVLDATHVVTAAHCLVDDSGVLRSPIGYEIVAGTNDLTDPDATVVGARTLSIDDQFDPDTLDHDVGVIELSSPLWTGPDPTIDGTSKIAPIPLVSDDTTFTTWLNDGVTATVSGWGWDQPVACHVGPPPSCDEPTGTAGLPSILQTVDIPLIDPTTCADDFGTGQPFETTITPTMFCAGDASHADDTQNKDACSGDSGGPLVVDSDQTTPNPPNDFVLAGLVDSGFGCAQQNLPGIYTRVSEPSVAAFIQSRDPQLIAGPTISGGSQVGQTITCDPGTWNGGPTFLYRLYRDSSAGPLPITVQSPSPTFTLPPSAGGRNVFCEVQAALPAGHSLRTADSNEIAVVSIPAPPTPPVTPPTAKDTTAPRLRIVHKACTKTACTIKVTVTDPGSPSSGVARVKATLSFTRKAKCRRTSAARSCSRRVRRTLRAKAGSGGKFTIDANHLTPGKGYTISLVPFDKAGNRPQFSTITNIRTKPRHTRGLF
jgi:trypsin